MQSPMEYLVRHLHALTNWYWQNYISHGCFLKVDVLLFSQNLLILGQMRLIILDFKFISKVSRFFLKKIYNSYSIDNY